MKLLFVGEGPHDIGPQVAPIETQNPAAGVVGTLACRAVPTIDKDSSALRWTQLARFHPDARKSGFAAKVAAAILISGRKFGLDGTICVADQDRDRGRLAEMQAGRERGLALLSFPHAAVCAVAVESIEAWTLGAHSALAAELGIPVPVLKSKLPSDVEDLYESSGKLDKRPKQLLQRLAAEMHRNDGVDLRTAVAQRTDPDELAGACPRGFAPFLARLRSELCCPSG